MRPPAWSTPSAARNSRRKARISRSGYFLTFLYLPPAEDAARAEAWLYEGRDRARTRMRARCCAASSTAPSACLALVEGFMPEGRLAR